MCKQGSRSPSWFPHCSVMPNPSTPPLLPLPRAPPAFSTAGDHQEQGTGRKNLGKADFSSPVMSINSLKKIYLKACRLVSLPVSPDLTICAARALHLWHTAGPGRAPPRSPKPFTLSSWWSFSQSTPDFLLSTTNPVNLLLFPYPVTEIGLTILSIRCKNRRDVC